jgi:hypothetical protein
MVMRMKAVDCTLRPPCELHATTDDGAH